MIQALVEQHRVDRLIVMPGVAGDEFVLRSLRWANTRPGLNVFVVPRFFDLGSGMDSVSPDRVRGYPLTQLDQVSHRQFGLAAKRVFDVTAAGLAAGALATAVDDRGSGEAVGSQGPGVLQARARWPLWGADRCLEVPLDAGQRGERHEWMGEAEARVTRVGALAAPRSTRSLSSSMCSVAICHSSALDLSGRCSWRSSAIRSRDTAIVTACRLA